MTTKPDKPPKRQIDWERIEQEYRAGQLSIGEVARQHGVVTGAIHNRAKRYSWTRNLAAAVRQAVQAKLVTDGVTDDVTGPHAQEAIERAAVRGVEVVRQHRKDISTGRLIVASLMEELTQASERRDEIEEEVELETAGDRDTKRRNLMLRAVSLPSRAGVIRDLSGAMRNLVGLERQAFSLDVEGGSAPGVQNMTDEQIDSRLAQLGREAGAS